MRILRADDVRAAVAMPQAIASMRAAFAQMAQGAAHMPERVAVSVPEQAGTTLVMPAYLAREPALGMKVVSVFPRNGERGLPTVPAMVLLLNAETGLPLALLEGTYLTALRTGAASGLATDLLARPDARVMTLFGAGGQAPFQLEAVCQVRRIERAWLVNRTPERSEALRERVLGWPEWRPGEVLVARTAAEQRQAVEEADVIATATAATEPLFPGEWVCAGTHLNLIGAFTPHMREVDGALVRRARVVVDQRAAALAGAGDLLLAMREGLFAPEAIDAELGEVVMGSKARRTDPAEVTIFKSVGVATQDVAVASAAYQEARRRGLGVDIDLYATP